jgi:hypothetical protein
MIRPIFAVLIALTLANAAAAAAPIREWTVLVWLCGENNLDPFAGKDLDEMVKVGSSNEVNVVVQADRLKLGCKRYYIRKGAKDQLADLGTFDMGDYKNLVAFAQWAAAEYPSRRTMVVLWNHGSGWRQRADGSRGVAYDDGSHNHITTEQLGIATRDIAATLGRKIDLLGFDACLMNMFEVAYEVRASTGSMVGSEELEPGDGWPYDKWLPKLTAKPSMGGRELGAAVCAAYASSYWIQKVMLSTIDCGALDELRARTDALVEKILADASGTAKAALATAREKVMRFGIADNADFFHAVQLFRDAVTGTDLKNAATRVLDYKASAVTANNVWGLPFAPKNCNGLAVYFPRGGGSWSSYRKLAFAQASKWDEMLGALRFEELHQPR